MLQQDEFDRLTVNEKIKYLCDVMAARGVPIFADQKVDLGERPVHARDDDVIG